MTRKTERLYTVVLLTIQQLVPGFNPTFAIGDFEQASRNAFIAVFPSITIISCWFHFTKAICERVPLLPEEEIRSVYLSWEIPSIGIDDAEKEVIKKFTSYFHRTWIIGHENLSVFIYENATNNGAESYHKNLKAIIKTPHPNIWKFTACLENAIAEYDTEYQRLFQGFETTRGPNSIAKAKRTKRNSCKDKFLNGSLNTTELLNCIALTIGRAHYIPELIEDEFNDASISGDTNTKQEENVCHVCLLTRNENFALLHNDYVHGGFCQSCAEHLTDIKVNCPICREEIKGILKIFQ